MSGTYDHLVWAESMKCGGPGPKAVLMTIARMCGLQEDGTMGCWPSQKSIAEITEQTVRSVTTHMAALEAKGLITRTRRYRPMGEGRGRTTDMIRITFIPEALSTETFSSETNERLTGKPRHDLQETDNTAEEPVEELVEESVTNLCRKPKRELSPEAETLANLLADLISDEDIPRPNVTQTWVTEIDRMIRLDSIAPETVEAAIRWSQGHEFWSGVVLSPKKLRKHYAAMVKQSKQEKRKVAKGDQFAGIREFLANVEAKERAS